MPSWEIKGLKLEESALKNLDGFFAHHMALVSICLVYLLILLGGGLILLLCFGRRKSSGVRIRPAIFTHQSNPPPPTEPPFDPFPPMREPPEREHDDY
jgi:hypothetical protein